MANFTGYLLPSFGDIYFGSMLMTPEQASLGFIQEDTSVTIRFENPSSENKTLNTIVFSNLTGAYLTGLVEGKVFASEEIVDFTLTVPEDGESVINGSVTFVFDDATSYEFAVSGVRALFWVYPPRDTGYSEEISFKTIIFSSDNRTEYRKSLLTNKVHRVTYLVEYPIVKKLEKLFGLFELSTDASFTVPLWHSAQKLTSPLTSGSFLALCDTSAIEAGSTGYLLLFHDEDTFDFVTFTSKTSTYFALGSAPVNNYTTEDVIMPLFFGRVRETNATLSVSGYNKGFMQIEFMEDAQ